MLRLRGIRCWSASQCTRLNLFPLVQQEGRWLCNLHRCPAATSALSAMVSSSCPCSPTACNESSVSEPWHAQMINWWQRELIKEIKLGTQWPRCYTCTCSNTASSREGIIYVCVPFIWFAFSHTPTCLA